MRKISAKCPSCAKEYRIAEELLGRRIQCSKCTDTFILAADETLKPQSAGVEDSTPGTLLMHEAELPIDCPSRIGRFQIQRVLGTGTFGTVYLATDPTADRDVALKVPHDSMLSSDLAKKRFQRESRAAARLRHLHIVPVYEVGQADVKPYISMAFIGGHTLKSVIQNERLDERRAIDIVTKISGALEHAHAQGIVHRDVKPANIILDETGEPFLVDFGLAAFLDAASPITSPGTVMGTPAYMSPEQTQGSLIQVGPASDQYSLGAVFYELLCGRPTFEGAPMTVMYQIRHESPPRPRDVSPSVSRSAEAVCWRMIEKEPDARFTSMSEVVGELRRLADIQPNEEQEPAIDASDHDIPEASAAEEHEHPMPVAAPTRRPYVARPKRKIKSDSWWLLGLLVFLMFTFVVVLAYYFLTR